MKPIKINKVISILLIIVILMTSFSFVRVYSTDEDSITGYYEGQLTSNLEQQEDSTKYSLATKFYKAMEYMAKNGNFEKDEDLELVGAGFLTKEEVKNNLNNNVLLYSMGAARDAFSYDHSEIFYVDFSYISIRVTNDNSGNYYCYLGKGRSDTFLRKGFKVDGEKLNEKLAEVHISDAIKAYEAEMAKIIDGAPKQVEEGKNLTVEQIKYVHNKIINRTTYRLDSSNEPIYKEKACTEGYEGFVRTPYGALVKQESLCEGYSRTLKLALDKLNIPSVLVYGTYVYTKDQLEEHMWNYVQVDNKWYGVDSTFDDPLTAQRGMDYVKDDTKEKGIDSFENEDYLLVGKEIMVKHNNNGVLSEAEFEFGYPELESNSYGMKEVSSSNGMTISYKLSDDNTIGTFNISYANMGISEAQKKGIYFLYRMWEENPAEVSNKDQDQWMYMIPEIPQSGISSDEKTVSSINFYKNIPYVQFAITDVEPGPWKVPADTSLGFTVDNKYTKYLGKMESIITSSEILKNDASRTTISPQLSYCTPAYGNTLLPGRTYRISFAYKEKLVADGSDIKIVWQCPAGLSAKQFATVGELHYSDDYTSLYFDFTPSDKWADIGVWYYFQVKGLRGQESNLEPTPIRLGLNSYKPCIPSMRRSHNWDMYARPTYVSSNITVDTEDGKKLLDENSVDYRITLFVQEPAEADQTIMEQKMEDFISKDKSIEGNKKLVKSTMYDLELNVCNKNLVRPEKGDKVKISLGFPKGYGPNDAGVVFKAYHYIVEHGEIVRIEEIPCVVTQYGLMITCDSFSPIAIGVIEGTSIKVDASGEPIKDENGKTIANTDKTVTFVSDETSGKVQVEGMDATNTITLAEGQSKDVTVTANEGFVIESITVNGKEKVTEKGTKTQTFTIKYDDLKDLPQNGLVVDVKYLTEARQQDEINAKQEPVVEPETEISSFNAKLESDKKAVEKGEEFTVVVKIGNFKNMGDGIVAIGGKLEYDKTKLERKSIEKVEPWAISENDFNNENFKFVTVNDAENGRFTTEDYADVFKVTFKVKEEAAVGETTVKLSSIEAGKGVENGLVTTSDVETKIQIQEKQEEPAKITSTVYKVDNENFIISDIETGVSEDLYTTFADFEKNVVKNRNIIYKDKDGNVMSPKSDSAEDKEAFMKNHMKTGMQIAVGDLTYKIVVRGDLDGNGKLDVNDLALMKIHIIETKLLENEYFKAALLDNNDTVSVNDLAILKIGLISDEGRLPAKK